MPLYTIAMTRAMKNAREIAAKQESPVVCPNHLLLAVLKEPQTAAGSLLLGLQSDRTRMREELEQIPHPPGRLPEKGKPTNGPDAKRLLEMAAKLTKQYPLRADSTLNAIRYKLSGVPVATHHILFAALQMGGPIAEILQKFNVRQEAMEGLLEFIPKRVG